MRQFLLIGSIVGLFMYSGFVLQADGAALAPTAGSKDLAPLVRAMAATGAPVERVTISGWVPVSGKEAASTAATALGWKGTAPKGEVRESKVVDQKGGTYLVLRWVMTGEAAVGWPEKQARIRTSLAEIGPAPSVTVQLEGTTTSKELIRLGTAALDAVAAHGQQPWVGSASASTAGRTDQLPPSPFGVNIQVASRLEAGGQRARVWVAWPALQQEY